MKIAYVTNAKSDSGVGHRAVNIARRLQGQSDVELDVFVMNGEEMTVKKNGVLVTTLTKWPGALGKKTVGWVRLGRVVKSEVARGDYDVVHLTNQTLSFLVNNKSTPSVVTVHDIIEVLDPQTRGGYLVNKYLYSGIDRADHIIAVSRYTAGAVRKYYGVPEDGIRVIYNGVGDEFHPIDGFKQSIAYQTLRQELKLGEEAKVVLYVGSDHPRKNVVGAVRAFAQMRERRLGLVFVKVGEPGIKTGRAKLLEEIDKLAVREAVRFVGTVPDDQLNELYNLADVLIYPSWFEGFGLPPLQAMKCGTPVVCSNATSLPEVVGDAALTHEPDDIGGLANSAQKILENSDLARNLRTKGLARAKMFSWEAAANDVRNVYKMLGK